MALFTAIGTAITAGVATGIAATAVGVGATAAVGAAGFGLASMFGGGDRGSQSQQAQMPTAPTAPNQADAAGLAQQQATDKKRAMARSQSVKTNPLGIKDEATVVRKKLLGS